MFDLTTILTLIAPAFIALLACRLFLRALGRAEASRRADRPLAPPARIVLDPAATTFVAVDPVVTTLAAEDTRERSVA
jgi:hypothetical protein